MNFDDLDELNEESICAAWAGESVGTWQRNRALGIGPAYIKKGRKVLYRRAAIRDYYLAQEKIPPRSKINDAA